MLEKLIEEIRKKESDYLNPEDFNADDTVEIIKKFQNNEKLFKSILLAFHAVEIEKWQNIYNEDEKVGTDYTDNQITADYVIQAHKAAIEYINLTWNVLTQSV